jgi:hypothetical protein
VYCQRDRYGVLKGQYKMRIVASRIMRSLYCVRGSPVDDLRRLLVQRINVRHQPQDDRDEIDDFGRRPAIGLDEQIQFVFPIGLHAASKFCRLP